MKYIKTEDAVGHVMCHDITKIIPGSFKGTGFKKGHVCLLYTSLPEVSLGIVPAGGTLARLARQIPFVNAMELILTGEKISAEKALDMGLLNYVVKQEQVMDKAMEIARKFLSLSTSAVQIAKESVIALREIPLEQAFETEAMLGYKAFTGEDAKEGLDLSLIHI